jgi:phage terminase small subunit
MPEKPPRQLIEPFNRPEMSDAPKRTRKRENPLNPRQHIFVREYVRTSDVEAAAIKAGYSRHTARVIGSQLLQKLTIREAVKKLVEDSGISLERWSREIASIAFAELPDSKITHDHKLKALDQVGRHLGAFQDERAAFHQAFQIVIHIGNEE